jgi:putative ABC transport system permease protein
MQGVSDDGTAMTGTGGPFASPGKAIKMAPKLAYKNLFHDKLSLFVTLIGIVFSVVLVAVQCGLYLGSERTIAVVLDQAKADIWVVPVGTKSFDDASLLTGREKYAVLSTDGVAVAEELVVGFSAWRKPQGGSKAIVLVGSNWVAGGLTPWNLQDGSVAELASPNAVSIDRSYFNDLGIQQVGDYAEINKQRVQVKAVSKGIRSFTTLPYVFTSLKNARNLTGASAEQASYILVDVEPGADVDSVKKALAARLPDADVLTHDEFRKRSTDYWLFKTGAGMALIAGALLGVIVGVVIVAQTLYSSTKDHLNEFATLRALGASASYIHLVILIQALLSAVLGYLFGLGLSLLAIQASRNTTLLIVMTPKLAAALFVLTVAMCSIAAMSAILKVTRIDPAGVFSR